MSDWVTVSESAAVADGAGATYFVDDVEVAVFRVDGEWLAIEGRCPHKGASLGNGSVEGRIVSCPWHSWEFDLTTGEGVDRPGCSVATIQVREDSGSLQIDRDSVAKKSAAAIVPDDGIQRYLIRYGSLGWVGRFGTVDGVECRFRDRVVVQTNRGREIGEVLSDPDDRASAGTEKPIGEVLRVASADELHQYSSRSSRILDRVIDQSRAVLTEKDLPVEVVDGEILFDGESAVLYFLGESHPDAGPLVTDVAQQHDLERIELCPVIDPPASGGGCGKPGCGGGGCSAD